VAGGDGNDSLSGGAGNDSLDGEAGDDRLDGGAGDDQLAGGAGNDIYVVDSAGDLIVEDSGAGIDGVLSSVSQALAANVDNLTLTGSAAIDGTGNGLDNVIVGNAGANAVAGGDGNDSLAGGAGNDNLDGGSGDDALDGGDGNDVISDGSGANTLKGGLGSDMITGRGTMEGGKGDDWITGSSYYSADTYIFNLGDGKDSIYDYGYPGSLDSAYNDTLQFGAGIAASDVTVLHSGNDLVFRVGATDQVTVKDWFSSYSYYIEQVQFADGTQWTPDTLRAMFVLTEGTANADTPRPAGTARTPSAAGPAMTA
jgi:Ca2+-binding RTX toxin-like protein